MKKPGCTRTTIDNTSGHIKVLHSTGLPFVFGYSLDKWLPYKGALAKVLILPSAISIVSGNIQRLHTLKRKNGRIIS